MKLPPNTCPNIDHVIRSVNSVLSLCDCRFDEDDLSEIGRASRIIDDIIYELRGVEDIMEHIRTANSELRSAAIEQEDKCSDLETKLEDLKEQYDKLLNQ